MKKRRKKRIANKSAAGCIERTIPIPPLKPNRIKRVETAFQVLTTLSGLLGVLAGIFAIINGHRDHAIWAGCGACVAAVVALFCYIQDKAWKHDAPSITAPVETQKADTSSQINITGLPGFIYWASLEIRDIREERKRYIFDFGKKDAERLSVYISPDNLFTVVLTDSKSEPYTLKLPLGRDGFPVEQLVDFWCELGVGSDFSVLRIIANDEPRGIVRVPTRINLGTLNASNGVAGTDLEGNNGSWFSMCGSAVFKEILGEKQRRGFQDAFKQFRLKLESGDSPKKARIEFFGKQQIKFGETMSFPFDPERIPRFSLPDGKEIDHSNLLPALKGGAEEAKTK